MSEVPRVLVVDPDRENAAEVRKMLTSVGVAVDGVASYGVEAYTHAHDSSPDIIFMRVTEPLARPMQTLLQLSNAMPDVPIIVYSGEGNIRLLRQSMVAGAWDYLQEPLHDEDIEASIDAVLERKQRQVLRRSGEIEAPIPQGTIVTIFGAKGGIGKTTIASNLAIALAQEAQQSVALVDMDTRFGDVAITMDIAVERSIADLARNLDSIDRDTLQEYLVRHESGVNVLPSPTNPSEWRGIGGSVVKDVVDVLAQTHDFVVLDTPGTFNEQVAAALELGTMILLVTTLEMASIKDTVLALEMLHERFGNDEERIKIVLNRAGLDTGVHEDDVVRTLDSPVWWRIPQDDDVVRASQLGVPIVMSRPKSKVAVQIREMARVLAGVGDRVQVNGTARSAGTGKLLRLFWPFARNRQHSHALRSSHG